MKIIIFSFFLCSLSLFSSSKKLGRGIAVNLMIDDKEINVSLAYPGLKVCGVRILSTQNLNIDSINSNDDLARIKKGLKVQDLETILLPKKAGYFTDGVLYNLKVTKRYSTKIKIRTLKEEQTLKEFFIHEIGLDEDDLVVLVTNACE